MAVVAQTNLFSWDALDARTDLERLNLAIDNLPDDKIIQYLEVMRGNGRDDYPIKAMWHALIAGIVFQHESIESLIRELRRNPLLFQTCGFNPLPIQRKPQLRLVRNEQTNQVEKQYDATEEAHYSVPDSHNFSRFLINVIELEECLGLISAMLILLREQLMEYLPGFGEHMGYDGKAVESHSTGQKSRDSGQTSDPDADWGKHKICGHDKHGKAWEKVKSWFGYRLHVIADTEYEIPVAIRITPASHSEQRVLRDMIRETFSQTPTLADICKDFSADRGLDCGKTKAMLWDDYGIRPLIDTRLMWREEKNAPDYDPSKPITRPLNTETVDNITYTERGSLHCICPQTGEQRDLAFHGFEVARNTLKYRCPAAAYGFDCHGKAQCLDNADSEAEHYGRTVRINLNSVDRRIFVPTPHGSPAWQRGYNRRSAMERINSRIDNDFCFEKHYIRGKAKMETRMGLAVAVMMAMALGHVKAGRQHQMRSLVQPIDKAA